MVLCSADSYDLMSRKAAIVIAAQIIAKPESVLGLATGSTPVGTYRYLVDFSREGDLDWSQITTFNLDEYRGVSPDDPNSYHWFMKTKLFDQINIGKSRTFLPDGADENAGRACEKYDTMIRDAGGIDLQLLGLGRNGHIGFNEPGSCFVKNTHCVSLSPSTIDANRRFFNGYQEVPRQAYTMGINTIMKAKRILLLVSGREKADILHKVIYGPITPDVPASILQMHGNVTVIADKEALSEMQ
ncbi:MAG TPA: glucosamine-6-phosphate deaminase [Oribacterium sp.]|nr:glucosamine-6-phosphate deaminase [Oribacterium sp.]